MRPGYFYNPKQVLGFSVSLLISTCMWLGVLVLFVAVSHAEISEKQAVRCVIGEASGEGYEGMVAVAEAMRNRIERMGVKRAIKRVDGCYAKHIDSQPKWVFWKAKKAWRVSKKTQLVKGADHWHADWIPTPYWAKKKASPNVIQTAKVGQHRFYRGVK